MFKGFQKPKRLVANTETLSDRYGMFTAQPFERGFGSTIGTGLRRGGHFRQARRGLTFAPFAPLSVCSEAQRSTLLRLINPAWMPSARSLSE